MGAAYEFREGRNGVDFKIFLFIWLSWVLVAACKLLVVTCWVHFPAQELNLDPLHWQFGVLATGPGSP